MNYIIKNVKFKFHIPIENLTGAEMTAEADNFLLSKKKNTDAACPTYSIPGNLFTEKSMVFIMCEVDDTI